MKLYPMIQRGLILLCLVLPGSAMADWTLNPELAQVNFISIKNNAIAELHGFGEYKGHIDANAKAEITIRLATVKTGIDIRDERLQAFLFDTDTYPKAIITAQLDKQWLDGLEQGQASAVTVDLKVDLHGQVQTIPASIGVIIDKNGCLHVESLQPILLNAGQFGLVEGIAKLQELAGLQAIATAVPVTFGLVFKVD